MCTFSQRNNVVLTATKPALNNLIISEYYKKSDNSKYIEIYNGTGAPVNLGNYRLKLYANGGTATSANVLLTGTLAHDSCIVYGYIGATAYSPFTVNGACNFNGNDAVALTTSAGDTVDIFGCIGENPGTAWTVSGNSTADSTLVRNGTVTAGNTANTPGFPTLGTEWTRYPLGTVAYLGSHTVTAAAKTGTLAVTVLPQPTASNIFCAWAPLTSAPTRDTHVAGDTLYVCLEDDDANLYRTRVDSVTIGLLTTRGDSELLVLTEGGADSRYFYGSIASRIWTGSVVGNQIISVRPGDTVALMHQDPQTASDSDVQIDIFDTHTQAALLVADAAWQAADGFLLGGSIFIEVNDPDQDSQPAAIDYITVTLTTAGGDVETLVLAGSNNVSDTFRNSIVTTSAAGASGDGTLNGVATGDSLTVAYADKTDATDTERIANIRLVADGPATLQCAADTAGTDKYLYILGDTLYLVLVDRDENLSPSVAETITVLVYAENGETMPVVLTAVNVNGDTFFGQVKTVTGGPDTTNALFQPSLGDSMTVTYIDNDSAADVTGDSAMIDNITNSTLFFLTATGGTATGYVIGDTLYVLLLDADENSNPAAKESVTCTLAVGSDTQLVVLTEAANDTEAFRGEFATAVGGVMAGDSIFQSALALDTAVALYRDKEIATSDSSAAAVRLVAPTAALLRFTDTMGGWLAATSYRTGDTIYLVLVDADRNLNIAAAEQVTVTVYTGRGDSDVVTLTESGISSDTFTGALNSAVSFTPTKDNATVEGIGGDTIQARFTGVYGDSAAANALFDSPSFIALLGAGQVTVYGYYPGDTVYVRVTDPDANTDPTVTNSVTVTIASQKVADTETVTLYETGLNTGIFFGGIMSDSAGTAKV
ncbi:MAG TPA: lamin tail domain-containing protein, partial [bacterium]|nr:lamin tail domain-containing protein [bacterium]